MVDQAAPLVGRSRTRLFYLLSLPIWLATVIRAAGDTSFLDDATGRVVAALLLAFAVLLVGETRLGFWFTRYRPLYLVVQAGLIVSLMALADDLDYFAILFIPLSTRVMLALPRRSAS